MLNDRYLCAPTILKMKLIGFLTSYLSANILARAAKPLFDTGEGLHSNLIFEAVLDQCYQQLRYYWTAPADSTSEQELSYYLSCYLK